MKSSNHIHHSCWYVAGDFNYPGIDRPSNQFFGNSYEQQFYDTINEYALYQHVSKPTRFRPRLQPHILDLMFTSDENMVDSVSCHSGLGSSDH